MWITNFIIHSVLMNQMIRTTFFVLLEAKCEKFMSLRVRSQTILPMRNTNPSKKKRKIKCEKANYHWQKISKVIALLQVIDTKKRSWNQMKYFP